MASTGPDSTGRNFTPTTHHDTYPFISPTTLSLHGKHVFITGASKGIGRATALAYARAGVSALALSARSSLSSLESEIASAANAAGHPPPKVVAYEMDVTSRESIEGVAGRAAHDLDGRLDILINNAGYLETFTPIVDSDPDEWWKTWTVNMLGPYLVTRAFLPLMLRGGDKTIVNLSSVGAHGKRPGASGYQTTKLAVCRFTEFIMAEYGAEGVLAFAVHPGGVMTELAAKMPKHTHGILIDTPEMGGDTITFLTGEKRTWLAGRYISCNWDMEEFLKMENDVVERDLLKFRMAV
ncbi:hypothetical protein MMC17_008365 [Xylographa soralifera]|nr:hypothetical protein [Xylographa soralifera]